MDWLHEAAVGTYLPILDLLHRLIREGHSPRLTLGLTPVLTEQLASAEFAATFPEYVRNRIDASRKDQEEFARTGEGRLREIALHWETIYRDRLTAFNDVYGRDLVGAFRELQEQGAIEIITCAATHGYLPLLGRDECVQAQIRQAVLSYERYFQRRPRGIWLPECAYRPRYEWKRPLSIYKQEPACLRKGIEEFLGEEGIDFFIIDSHLLRGGKAVGVYLDRFETLQRLWGRFEDQYPAVRENEERSPYQVYGVGTFGVEKKRPVCVLTRDPKTGVQVWSGKHGYPGNPWYLDFHKKHFPGGNRYWRVTDSEADLSGKEIYEPERIEGIVREQAEHFTGLVREVLADARSRGVDNPLLTAPYDAELFGHWWFEGPEWLYEVLKRMDEDPMIHLTTGSRHLSESSGATVITLPEGSWGEGGFHWIWLNEWTEWVWKRIYEAEDRMVELAREFRGCRDPLPVRILNQLGRELLLLESSDWPFLISTWSARDYAEIRVSGHVEAFRRLALLVGKAAQNGEISADDEEFVTRCERRDGIFPDLDFRWWAEVDFPVSSV